MAINFPCPHCGQTYKLNDNQVGTKGRCAKCQKVFVVTAPTPPQLAATASLPKPAAAQTPSPRRTDPAPRPDPLTSPIPRQLGRFEVRGKLGQGTFGAVYRAFDAILKREVAIKLPHAAALALEGVGERFLREAEAAAQLHHPNIVPVHDAGVCDGQLYIASAFIDGQTLQSAMRDEPLDHRRAARLIMKLADALAYAHDKGIVHRDVKPGNVMLDSHDEPYVMDFGLARWEQAGSQLTQDGSLLGTPAYMSPEQAGAPVGKVGPASDQYALGVMLYEMLVGRVPFSDSQLPVVLSKIRDEEAVSPRSLDGSIPLDLETICLKAMSKRPQDRYVDGRALAADLRRWLDGEPIQARRLGVIERTVRWARKNKAVAGSLATVAASLILLAVMSSISAARMAVLRDQEAGQRQIAEDKQREAEAAKVKETAERERADILATKESDARKTAEKQKYDSDQAALLARRHLYIANMNLVQAAWNDSNVGRAREIIDQYRDANDVDGFRNFEWYYWNRTLKREAWSTKIASSAVAISPDGRQIAASIGRAGIQIWDTTTYAPIQTLLRRTNETEPLKGMENKIAYSPKGDRLATASLGGHITIWDLTQGTSAFIIPAHTKNFVSIAFSPDGSKLASSTWDNNLRIWDPSDGKNLFSATMKHDISDISFTDDNNHIAVCYRASAPIDIVDISTGAIQMSIGERHEGYSYIHYNQSHSILAAISRYNCLTIWHHNKHETRFNSKAALPSRPTNVAISPDGQFIAVGCIGDTIYIVDADTSVIMSHIKSATFDDVQSMCFTSDSKRLLEVHGQTLNAWDVDTLQERHYDTRGTHAVRTCATLKRNVIAFPWINRELQFGRTSQHIGIWASEEFLLGHSPDNLIDVGDSIIAVDTSADGRYAAYACIGGPVFVADTKTAQRTTTFGSHKGSIAALSFHPDGDRIASLDQDMQLYLWSRESGRVLQHIELSRDRKIPNARAVFSSNGKILATSDSEGIRLWDAKNATLVRTLVDSKGIYPTGLSFSDDGEHITCGSVSDHLIRVWNAGTGDLVTSIHAHRPVISLSFNPDGTRLAALYYKGLAEVWDVSTAKVVLSLPYIGETGIISFSKNGDRICVVTTVSSSLVYVWDARE